MYAVDRTRRQAKLTSSAPICQYRMHHLVDANNCIDWACSGAKIAADAYFLVNDGDLVQTRRA
jgi:hypothetical protein